jgi:diguanylate cyclase (GGDEF)-like protein
MNEGGMEAGKSRDPELVQRLRRAVTYRQVEQRKNEGLTEQNAALEQQALSDKLTGLPNRRGFETDVQNMFSNIEKGGREGDEATVVWAVMMDIDRFKSINDTIGHAGGDAVLREVGAYLKQNVRDTDIVARLGGEEFVILFVGNDKIQAAERAEELRSGVQKLSVSWEGERVPVTMSLGVAQVSGLEDVDAAIQRADAALYTAKEDGRNRFKFFAEAA